LAGRDDGECDARSPCPAGRTWFLIVDQL